MGPAQVAGTGEGAEKVGPCSVGSRRGSWGCLGELGGGSEAEDSCGHLGRWRLASQKHLCGIPLPEGILGH